MQHDSRDELGELAHRLDDLLAGRSHAELADLVLLADGLTTVLVREVQHARTVTGTDRSG